MQKTLKLFLLMALLAATWVIRVYHLGTMPIPSDDHLLTGRHSYNQTRNQWIDKKQYGMHQLILSGTPFERGQAAGIAGSEILEMQEDTLIRQLNRIVPSSIFQQVLFLAASRWFWGIESYLEDWMTDEMYGVSLSGSKKYNSYADSYTRQVAYHGLHEIGQLMVDSGAAIGCTVLAARNEKSWILGRNFDFEGGRIFDTEKIIKWVFPQNGYAYASVIWIGMVGAVTGVNENGIYLSLNAAGSRDFRRYGTPSTLVLAKALQYSMNADEAIQILKNSQMFISDIFVLLDSRSGKLYRIEKSPLHTEVIQLNAGSVVTNHLISERWANDLTNVKRRDEQTSLFRQKRGETLLSKLDSQMGDHALELKMLEFLRDKGEVDGRTLNLGNRRAIDSLIATHSVIYNGKTEVLYVSQGPGVSGSFTGFDLKASFTQRKPISIGDLPPDPLVSQGVFKSMHEAEESVREADAFLNQKDCVKAKSLLESAEKNFSDSVGLHSAWGDYYRCEGNLSRAKQEWQKALSMHPPYAWQIRTLQEKLK